jgi:hypothetical protein
MRWLAALLFAGGLAAGLGAGLTGTAHASDPTRPARPWNEIFLPFGNGTGTSMCVDVPGGTSAPGARLQLYRCHGYASDGAPQRWSLSCAGGTGCASGGRFYELSNPGSDLCIGFPDGGVPANGARLVQESCGQVPDWQLVPQGRGSRGNRESRGNRDDADPHVMLETSGPGGPALCMTAGNLSDDNQTPLVAAPCQGLGNAAQILELG